MTPIGNDSLLMRECAERSPETADREMCSVIPIDLNAVDPPRLVRSRSDPAILIASCDADLLSGAGAPIDRILVRPGGRMHGRLVSEPGLNEQAFSGHESRSETARSRVEVQPAAFKGHLLH